MDLQGQDLIVELQNHSEIEKSNFNYHFSEILENYNVNPDDITLDQLRDVLANYIQDLILELNEA